MRKLNYARAISEAHSQLLESDKNVVVIGQGLWSPWYAGQSISELDKKFGKDRIIDTPVSENGVTAAAIGAAMNGLKPILFHPRMDFMMLAVDPIVNQAANWSYMFNGQVVETKWFLKYNLDLFMEDSELKEYYNQQIKDFVEEY